MPPSRQPEILVVDDDDGIRLLITDALRSEGYAVRAAASAAAAIAAGRTKAPDLVLLDLQLKDGSGRSMVERLRREGLRAPFVVVTGQGDQKVAVEMMRQGALDYVMKDTTILDLLPGVVKRAWDAVQRERSLAEVEAERRRLERQILELSEAERRQFGADLHDGIGQRLTAIELMFVSLRGDVEALDPKLGGQIGEIAELLRGTIAQTRAMARGLSPLGTERDALQTALVALAAQTDALGRARCRTDISPISFALPPYAAVHLFRIAQEAVNNAVRHSQATDVVIRLTEGGSGVILEIQDNGRGLTDAASRGLGLGLMRYRADMIGGSLVLNSKPGTGLTVRCVAPMTKS